MEQLEKNVKHILNQVVEELYFAEEFKQIISQEESALHLKRDTIENDNTHKRKCSSSNDFDLTGTSDCNKMPTSESCVGTSFTGELHSKENAVSSNFVNVVIDQSGSDFLTEQNQHYVRNVLISTPKRELMKKLNVFPGGSENETCLDETIDDAIEKYEEVDAGDVKEYKEVSVQTNLFECSCISKKLNNTNVNSPKKRRINRNIGDYFAACRYLVTETDCSRTEDVLEEEFVKNKVSESEHLADIFLQKDNKHSLPNLGIFKATPRIRLGLSKRDKPSSLHNKLIY